MKEEKSLKKEEYAILLQILTSLYFQKGINFVLPPLDSREEIFPLLENHLKFIMNMAHIGIDKDKLDDNLLKK